MITFRLPVPWLTKAAAFAAALALLGIPISSRAQVFLSFNVGAPPPPLPAYSQPMLSAPGDEWQPGYWAWGPAGYYWVPGTWVAPPSAGLYWTPGYWGYNAGSYAWNNGYWAPNVGYYGGIDYGFGYNGLGYAGGYWNNGAFAYNTAVTNVNRRVVRNVYVRHVTVRRSGVRYAFNGPGGVRVRPTARQLAVLRGRRIAPTRAQIEYARVAARNRSLYARYNHGRPAVAALARPAKTTRAFPHYRAITAADRRAADRLIRRRDTTHAQNMRARAQAAKAHANTPHARAHAARLHAQAARAHARAAQAHAQAARIHRTHERTRASRVRARDARANARTARIHSEAAREHAQAAKAHAQAARRQSQHYQRPPKDHPPTVRTFRRSLTIHN